MYVARNFYHYIQNMVRATTLKVYTSQKRENSESYIISITAICICFVRSYISLSTKDCHRTVFPNLFTCVKLGKHTHTAQRSEQRAERERDQRKISFFHIPSATRRLVFPLLIFPSSSSSSSSWPPYFSPCPSISSQLSSASLRAALVAHSTLCLCTSCRRSILLLDQTCTSPR